MVVLSAIIAVVVSGLFVWVVGSVLKKGEDMLSRPCGIRCSGEDKYLPHERRMSSLKGQFS